MTLSFVFLAFCENCTWEIIPMLIGSWLLGWLFWWLFNRNKYQNKISTLENDLGAMKAEANAPLSNIALGDEAVLRISGDLKKEQKQNQGFNAQLDSLRAELKAQQKSNLGYKTDFDNLNNEISATRKANLDLNTEVDKVKSELKKTQQQNFDLKLQLKAYEDVKHSTSTSTDISTPASPTVESDDEKKESILNIPVKRDYATAKTIESKTSFSDLLKSDDLKIVEGVGPKIESLMKSAGINTWVDLANTAPSKIQNILNEAGPRYRVHDPKTWPKQARLANDNNWDALIAFQKDLGKARTGSKDNPGNAKVEKLYMKAKGIKAFAPDDLKIVEGIGPKIEGLLKASGINDWTILAATEQSKIKSILTAAGERYRLADPSTWPKQAGLAAKGNWEELKAYQDRLKGGKE